MIGCLWTRVRKQPIIARYFESEPVLKFYNLEASNCNNKKLQTNSQHHEEEILEQTNIYGARIQ